QILRARIYRHLLLRARALRQVRHVAHLARRDRRTHLLDLRRLRRGPAAGDEGSGEPGGESEQDRSEYCAAAPAERGPPMVDGRKTADDKRESIDVYNRCPSR